MEQCQELLAKAARRLPVSTICAASERRVRWERTSRRYSLEWKPIFNQPMRFPGCACLHRARGPRSFDSHQRAAVHESIIHRYQLAVQGFTTYCLREFPYITTPEDFDDAIIEYKQSR